MNDCTTYLRAFSRISRSMQQTYDMDAVLSLIVESAVSVLNAKACCLFLNDQNNQFVPAAHTGLTERYIQRGPGSVREITNQIQSKGGYLAIENAQTDPRVENHEEKKAEGIASMLMVPVLADAHPIGMLVLYTETRRRFSDQEIDFLSALADQGGMTLQKARERNRKQQNSELLDSITTNLNSSLDITKVLHIMSAEIAETFNLLGVTIRLHDEDKNEMTLVASYGLSETYLNKGPVSSDRLNRVVNDKVELVDDIDQEGLSINYIKERKAEGIASMLHLPITVKDTVIGIMGLYSNTRRSFSDEDVRLMHCIARQGGLAIQNASLYLQLKQDKEILESEIWSHKAWF